ncbi:MAG: dTMP kinase [bacterium]|jgi:dTMP kinase|nr:dTMP kinase [bacterium]
MAGLFITIEGIEGAGKTTIAAKLEEWLTALGHRVYRTREPGGTPLGESLRQILLDANTPLGLEAELLLIEAARAQLMREVILPRLAAGETIVLDRHTDSTMAYQGYGRGLEKDVIQTLSTFATQGRNPDLTVLLDLDAETGLHRAQRVTQQTGLKDRFENEHIDFMKRIRQGFLAIAHKNPQRILLIPAGVDVDSVWQMIVTHLSANARVCFNQP